MMLKVCQVSKQSLEKVDFYIVNTSDGRPYFGLECLLTSITMILREDFGINCVCQLS